MAAVGSVTTTTSTITNVYPTYRGVVQKIQMAWTSDGSGDVSGHPFLPAGGALLQATFVPNTDSDQPTDAYDVVVTDAVGVDILNGAGANLSQSTSKVEPYAAPGIITAGQLDLVVSNAGNAKKGTVTLWFAVSA